MDTHEVLVEWLRANAVVITHGKEGFDEFVKVLQGHRLADGFLPKKQQTWAFWDDIARLNTLRKGQKWDGTIVWDCQGVHDLGVDFGAEAEASALRYWAYKTVFPTK